MSLTSMTWPRSTVTCTPIPELAFAERRTASIAAERLHGLGYQVTAAVGGTGVVGVLENGDGPTVLLRADMDALPVLEQTGLPYASTRHVRDADGQRRPCDARLRPRHARQLPARRGGGTGRPGASGAWQGRLLLVFQPAEEGGAGAQAMIDDGLYDRFPVPDIVLGQHVMPLPAGVLGLHGGAARWPRPTRSASCCTARAGTARARRPRSTRC